MFFLSHSLKYWVSQVVEVSDIFIEEVWYCPCMHIYYNTILATFCSPFDLTWWFFLPRRLIFTGLAVLWFESKWLTTFRIAPCLLYYDVWWDMMFDSFSASFPSRNTHPIRNLVNLLSMSHRFGYFCNEIHVAVHSLRQVHSTGHSECVFVVRRDLLLSLWRAQSLGVSASRFLAGFFYRYTVHWYS